MAHHRKRHTQRAHNQRSERFGACRRALLRRERREAREDVDRRAAEAEHGVWKPGTRVTWMGVLVVPSNEEEGYRVIIRRGVVLATRPWGNCELLTIREDDDTRLIGLPSIGHLISGARGTLKRKSTDVREEA